VEIARIRETFALEIELPKPKGDGKGEEMKRTWSTRELLFSITSDESNGPDGDRFDRFAFCASVAEWDQFRTLELYRRTDYVDVWRMYQVQRVRGLMAAGHPVTYVLPDDRTTDARQ
jgi:hypothetical protein